MLGQPISASWKSRHVKSRRCSYYSKKLSRQFLRWLDGGESKITVAIDKQLHQIREQIATEWVWAPIHLDKHLFSYVIRKISRFTLLKTKGIGKKCWTNSGWMYRLLLKCLWFAVCSYHASNTTPSFFGWYSLSVALWQACDLTLTSCCSVCGNQKSNFIARKRKAHGGIQYFYM